MKKGFTLTEIMIALAIIAILSVILMPMIFKLRPNQEVMMAKKAFGQAQTIVSEMINNENCYPFVYDRVGFSDERAYSCSQNGNGDRNQKFVSLFEEYLNPINVDNGTFRTKDGISWTLNSQFTQNGGTATITVDTGANRTFTMTVQPNGKIEIVEEWARNFVFTDRRITGNSDN